MIDTFAVDPGLATGWAHYKSEDGEAKFFSGEVEGRFVFEGRMRSLLHNYFDCWVKATGDPLRVVCEDYIISADTLKKSRQEDPLRIIGWLEGVCAEYEFEFTLQTPSQAKKFATDDKLKAVGFWNHTPQGHANDAARHLLRYLDGDPKVGPVLRQKLVEGLGL